MSDPVEPRPSTALIESYNYQSPLPASSSSSRTPKEQADGEEHVDQDDDRAPAEEEQQYWIMGIDEAGRGPVLGPMVYGAAYCPMSFRDTLQGLGFDDSKALTPETRDTLWSHFTTHPALCYSTSVIAPQSISKDMLKRIPFNLNRQAEEATISLIRGAIERGVRLKEVYVDALGDTTKWKAALSALFPAIEFTVEKKADATYKIVGAASIAAKVTRDRLVEHWIHPEGKKLPKVCLREREDVSEGSGAGAGNKRKRATTTSSAVKGGKKRRKVVEEDEGNEDEDEGRALVVEQQAEDDAEEAFEGEQGEEMGSGYPGDPKTVAYLKAAFHPVFGYPSIVRFSWSGVKIAMDRECASCRWIDDDEDAKKGGRGGRSTVLSSMFGSAATTARESKIWGGKDAKFASEIGLEAVGEL